MDARYRFNLVIAFWLLALSAFGQNQRAQSFTGTVGVTGAVVTVTGGATFNWGNTLVVDSINGVNATAARANGAKPFKDPYAAKNAASAGDVILVRRGIYTTNDLWKAGVTYYFEPGAVLEFTDPGSGTARGLFDDRADPGTTNIVTGYGTFRHFQGNFSGSLKGAFVVTNSLSRLYVTGRRVEFDSGPTDATAVFALEDGTNYVRFDEVESLGISAVGNSGIFFRNGLSVVDVDYMMAFSYCLYAKEITNSTGNIFYSGKHWKQHPSASAQSAIFVEPNHTGTANTNFLVVGHLDKLESIQGNVVAYAGRVYLTVDESISQGLNVLHEFSYACEYHLNAQKCIGSPGPGLGRSLWQMPLHTGRAFIRVEEWQHRDSTDPIMVLDGTGTVNLDGQYMQTVNSKGIQINSNGVYRIKNYRIDTSPTDDANNNPIYLSANAANVFLENVTLQAPPLATSIRGTNTIAIAGTLQVNTAPDTNMKFSSGGLMINGNFQVKGIILPPLTNSTTPFILNVTSNSFQRSSSVTNGTVTFIGTPVDGAIVYWEYINSSTTNQPIGIPSSIPLQVQGNAAITSYTCAGSSITTFRWERVSGTWQLSVVGPDLPATYTILTNSYSGFNVFLDLSKNTMQFLTVTNNFILILTNQNVGQKIGLTMYNITGTNCTITLPSVQIYGSGISNVVNSAKRLKTAWESQDTQVTNVSAAFAQQKN